MEQLCENFFKEFSHDHNQWLQDSKQRQQRLTPTKNRKNKNDLHQKSVNLLRFTGYRVTCQPVTFLKLFIKKT